MVVEWIMKCEKLKESLENFRFIILDVKAQNMSAE